MLYQKYRPTKFEDMVGQEYTSTILKNQIRTGHIAHSYLFCGTRGTGKTTSARILAKAVNCKEPINGEPCGKCDACKAMENGKAMDIIELDAASNNSVDDIREIISQMKYSPSGGKYKIFIIDECHMLSKSAMNAFLKALEEPPKHIIFILATTDPQNLPVTIISRCQRFDFRRIPLNKIVGRLTDICNKEQVAISKEILELIAKASDGAMRDALSILEKILSMEETERTIDNVAKILSMSGLETVSKLIDYTLTGDIFNTLTVLNDLDNEGQDFGLFIKDLIKYCRNLMLLSANGPEEIIAATKEDIAIMKQITAKASTEKIINLLELLQEAENSLRWNGNAKIALETVIIKINETTNKGNENANKEIIELKKMILFLQQQIGNVIATATVSQAPQNRQNHTEQNPILLAKQQIVTISNKYNKQEFANALANSKIFIKGNILELHSTSNVEKQILEKNKNNLINGFSKFLQQQIAININ